jgi:magnesium-transporting ATPase (P-type)
MQTEKGLFDLQVDHIGREHLKETAKWGRFLSIVGFVSLALLVLFIFFVAIYAPSDESDVDPVGQTAAIIGAIVVSIAVVIFYLFPCLFLYRFATKLRLALDTNDTLSLNESFRNLKNTLRYFGVVTIIFLVLMILGLFVNV